MSGMCVSVVSPSAERAGSNPGSPCPPELNNVIGFSSDNLPSFLLALTHITHQVFMWPSKCWATQQSACAWGWIDQGSRKGMQYPLHPVPWLSECRQALWSIYTLSVLIALSKHNGLVYISFDCVERSAYMTFFPCSILYQSQEWFCLESIFW